MTTKYLNRYQSRRVDQIAIQDFGIPGIVLMENAGRNCAAEILRVDLPENRRLRVVIACGSGNNGGDGFVIARHLVNHGIPVKLITTCDANQLRGDAAINFAIASKMKIPIVQYSSDWSDELTAKQLGSIGDNLASVLIDSCLGTGAIGNPRPPFDRLIRLANRLDLIRISIDVPSGLDCNTGVPNQPTFCADQTLSLVTLKTGYQSTQASQFLGEIKVIDIGIPSAIIGAVESENSISPE